MAYEKLMYRSSSFFSPMRINQSGNQNKLVDPFDEPPRKPDWLLVMVSILILLTILIAWLVDVPVLSR